MCGVVGYWTKSPEADRAAQIGHMTEQISHRGPDDSGTWLDENVNLALGHRRLSILDLSAAGHQPMISACGKYVLSYNGEIYNHQELRHELAKDTNIKWRGHSDTETLLYLLAEWGIEKTLQRLNGMFAFALWDKSEHILYLARDRMGEKPLYYGRSGDIFLFGSELKALRAHANWKSEINRDALTSYLRHNYIPSPYSIYRGIHKLPPAHFVKIQNNGSDISQSHCYWNLADIAASNVEKRNNNENADDLINKLDKHLREAVKLRMQADVPLGAFLSGGYDSTTVVAMMQQQSERPIRTFTIGFNEDEYNEAQHAKAVAKHLGTEHTELYITSQQAMDVIPKLPTIWDEPFSDCSQIPTYLVSKLAKQHVTVSLSGDGGDELFCGYNRYVMGYRIWRILKTLPPGVRKSLSFLLNHTPGDKLHKLMQLLPQSMRIPHLSDRLPKMAEVLKYQNDETFYQNLISHWKNPEDIVIDGHEPSNILNNLHNSPVLPDFQEQMMYLDSMTYLPGDILTKMDRASMAVSLEARIPLLDHNLVEFAWQVPTRFKFKDGQGKWLLRQVLYRYVPKKLMDRPKMGFGVPIDNWLRGPLRDWAENLLDEKKMKNENIFHTQEIRKMWEEHKSGKRRWHYQLWDVLMYQAWAEEHNKN